mmetsp:Transcript_12474/g.46158  ORF Transcript_12474/g.46158 Transcript_12474/m.46158 type:complete len:240 (-) Transcript_12474:11-730(-)
MLLRVRRQIPPLPRDLLHNLWVRVMRSLLSDVVADGLHEDVVRVERVSRGVGISMSLSLSSGGAVGSGLALLLRDLVQLFFHGGRKIRRNGLGHDGVHSVRRLIPLHLVFVAHAIPVGHLVPQLPLIEWQLAPHLCEVSHDVRVGLARVRLDESLPLRLHEEVVAIHGVLGCTGIAPLLPLLALLLQRERKGSRKRHGILGDMHARLGVLRWLHRRHGSRGDVAEASISAQSGSSRLVN